MAQENQKYLVMTKEDKDLVMKDLCGRLPYRVYVQVVDRVGYTHTRELTPEDIQKMWSYKSIKPYLRPMSSMTEEEKEQMRDLWIDADTKTHATRLIDFYNKHNFDFRGLIEKDLALSTDEFNPYED